MDYDYDYFHARLGREFIARAENEPIVSTLVLRDATLGRKHETTRNIRKQSFSLSFTGPAATDIGRKLVRLSCAGEEGSLLFYLEPMSLNDGVFEYEGVIG